MFKKSFNIGEALRCVLTSLPGLLTAYYLNDEKWIFASFFAVCAILPKSNRRICFSILLIIFSNALFLVYLSNVSAILFILMIVIITFIGGYFEVNNTGTRSFIAWIFIGSIYPGFRMHNYFHLFSFNFLFEIFLIACAGCFIGTLIPKKDTNFSLAFKFEVNKLGEYCCYAFPTLITLMTWYFFKYPKNEVHWFIWSSLSVTYLDLNVSKEKLYNRMFGAIIGVYLGFLALNIIPSLDSLHYLYFICIIASIRLFKSYIYGFIIRCFFVMLYAYPLINIGEHRLLNVIFGSLIGFACVILMHYLKKYKNHHLVLCHGGKM
jgi:hypothetical protein